MLEGSKVASPQTYGRFCLEKCTSYSLQRELFSQLQNRKTNGHHPWDFCNVNMRERIDVQISPVFSTLWTKISNFAVARLSLGKWAGFPTLVWLVRVCLQLKSSCLSSSPSPLSLIASIELKRGTTRHVQCACSLSFVTRHRNEVICSPWVFKGTIHPNVL